MPRTLSNGANRRNNQQWHFTNNNSSNNPIVCQLCDKIGHTAKHCWSNNSASPPQAHCTVNDSNNNNNWIMDLGAWHHITSDLQNLEIHSDYGGNDGIIIEEMAQVFRSLILVPLLSHLVNITLNQKEILFLSHNFAKTIKPQLNFTPLILL